MNALSFGAGMDVFLSIRSGRGRGIKRLPVDIAISRFEPYNNDFRSIS
jgi:hypothetical protein